MFASVNNLLDNHLVTRRRYGREFVITIDLNLRLGGGFNSVYYIIYN